MPTTDPSAAAQKWANKMAQAAPAYTAGINGVTDSPMAAAAAAAPKYLAGVQAAVQSGKFAAGLNRVSLAAWKQAAISKGADRLATGARQAQSKVQAFMGQWLPIAAQISAQAKTMPSNGIEDSIAKVRMAITMSKQFAAQRATGG